ncbi:MAG: hypothetical protein ACFHU9_09520 [Fluviicola sp.]
MRNYLMILILVLFAVPVSFSQNSGDAIGIRGGSGNFGYGPEISYQKAIGASNQFELDLGWRGNRNFGALSLSGIYHWTWNITGGLNWYIGPGAQVGFYNYRRYEPGHPYWDDDYPESGLLLAVGGQIGLEYDFNVHGAPIQLSIDSRPMWGFFNYYRGFGYGGALGLRYTF